MLSFGIAKYILNIYSRAHFLFMKKMLPYGNTYIAIELDGII